MPRPIALRSSAAARISLLLALCWLVSGSIANAQPTIVSGPFVIAVSADAAVINWTTSEESLGFVTYWTGAEPPQVLQEWSPSSDHHLTLAGLRPNTAYGYEVTITDLGNVAVAVSDRGTLETTDYSPAAGIELLWASQVQTNTDGRLGFTVLPDGSSVVAANMFGTRTYGSGGAAVTLTSAGGRDIALVRFDASGHLQWARRAGGTGEETATEVIALPDGSMVVAGYFNGASTFGPGESNETTIISDGYDTFAAKFDPDGLLVWVRRIEVVGASGVANPTGIVALPDGSVVVAAYIFDSAAVAIDGYSVTVAGMVTLRLDSSGRALWLKGVGGHAGATALSATADGFAAVGALQGTADFGAGEDNETTISAAPEGFAGFVARYSAEGSLIWAKRLSLSLVHSIVTMPDGSFALGGNGTYTGDGFVARWSSTGTALWTRAINGSCYVSALAALADGSIVAVGGYSGGAAVVDDGAGGSVTLRPNLDTYFSDLFVVRYRADGTVAVAFADGITAGGELALGMGGAGADSVVIAGQVGGSTSLGRGLPNEHRFEGVFGADTFLARYRFSSSVQATPTGSNIAVMPTATAPDGSSRSLSIQFDTVTAAGTTTVTAAATGPPPPDGFKLGQPPLYYDVTTTATFSGNIRVCFHWNEGELSHEDKARLFHREDNTWVDVTSSVDAVANVICGSTSSLSPFVIAQHRILGFYQPVDNAPMVNRAKAGSAIPVKFSLEGNEGLSIFAAGYPTSQAIACDTSAPIDAVEETVAAGGSNLSFDAVTNVYSYVWKSDRSWTNTCRLFTLKLIDGTTKSARFSLTK